MEFQEAVTRLRIHKTTRTGVIERHHTQTEKEKRKIFFRRSPASNQKVKELEIPVEFLCPVSGTLMNDPVIVSSGHTFERACVQACNTLGFTPTLMDGTIPDFSTVIPNLALKSTILNWCKKYSRHQTRDKTTLDFFSAEKLVRAKILEAQQQKPKTPKKVEDQDAGTGTGIDNAVTDLITHTPSTHDSWSSDDSLLQLKTRPSCYSSPSSSSAEIETFNPNPEEQEFVRKLRSPLVFDIEEGLVSLRNTTRVTDDDTRLQLCTTRLLSALQPLIISRYTNIQVNSVACLVNLSLEKMNKVKIVRSGILPLLIDVLKGGFPEAKEHASGAIFSLALDDRNKTAIGVLGALPPLLHLLRSDENDQTRHDSGLALYHLSLVQSNIAKLVKLGSVPILLGMVESGHLESGVLLILCNLALSPDGRNAMWDSGGVEAFVGLLRRNEFKCESTQEICVSVLYALSHGGPRFKGLARAAGAVEVLMQVEKTGTERTKENVRRIFKMMTETRMEEEEVDWEGLLDDSGTWC